MNCPNCKNQIPSNSSRCEWCGVDISINTSNDLNNSLNIGATSSKKVSTYLYLLPGIIILLIWIVGNLISERDKHAIFNMDDLSPILFLGLIVLAIGIIIKRIIK